MSEKEKTRLCAATQKRVSGDFGADGLTQLITERLNCQANPVAHVLPFGAANAQTAAELCKALGWSDSRSITRAVQQMRRDGLPVCATSDPARPGYYLPATTAELVNFLGRLAHRRRELGYTLDAVSEAVCLAVGQETIEEVLR